MQYSTQKNIITEKPIIENNPNDKVQTVLFYPPNEERKGEGGLRIQGKFKKSQTDKPLISIVTVVYNGAKTLEDTILSVLNQTYENIEYIIIDGGSTDGTVNIIKKYEDAIDYWISEPDGGIYYAMNKGIEVCTGDWINFMNSDDTLYQNSTLTKMFCDKRVNKLTHLYGDCILDGEKYRSAKEFTYKNLLIYGTGVVCHQSFFVPRKCCVKYNTRYLLKGELDWYFSLVANKDVSFIKKNIPIVSYHTKGVGTIHFWRNIKENLYVVYYRAGMLGILVQMPKMIYSILRHIVL